MAAPEKLNRHTLYLFKGDYERLRALYGAGRAALIVRVLVRKHLKAAETKGEITEEEIDL